MFIALAFAAALPLCAQVKITQQGKDKISIEIDGKPFTDFYIGPETNKPYLYPLRAADGNRPVARRPDHRAVRHPVLRRACRAAADGR